MANIQVNNTLKLTEKDMQQVKGGRYFDKASPILAGGYTTTRSS